MNFIITLKQLLFTEAPTLNNNFWWGKGGSRVSVCPSSWQCESLRRCRRGDTATRPLQSLHPLLHASLWTPPCAPECLWEMWMVSLRRVVVDVRVRGEEWMLMVRGRLNTSHIMGLGVSLWLILRLCSYWSVYECSSYPFTIRNAKII